MWAMWLWAYGRTAVPRRPSKPDLVLSQLLHAPISAELADQLVRDLPKRQLIKLWDDTTRLLGMRLRTEVRLNVVVLRDHLLRRLECAEPELVDEYLRSGHSAA